MAFTPANLSRLVKFNSAASSDFLELYETFVNSKIAARNSEPAHKTFAPSGFRCKRKMWFRLRGTEPDQIKKPDPVLNFTAEVGTAIHRIVQSNLKECLQDDYVEVDKFLEQFPTPYTYKIKKSPDSLEYFIEIENPPVRFACDGIIKLNGEYYLLEIKSSEFSSFDSLTGPKDEHIEQVKCYASLLGLSKVLFFYEDRQYGGIKVYEYKVNEVDKQIVLKTMSDVQSAVERMLPPEPLPKGDKWCTSGMCPYYKKCNEWGR